jgi:CSLREA domain-containing protein
VDVVIDVSGPYDDDEVESTETVILSVEEGDGYIPAANDTAVLLLVDNDTIPAPRPVTELVVNTVEDDTDPTNDATQFSLREAVLEANRAAVSGSYIITFAAAIQGQTIVLDNNNGELPIHANNPGVTISVTIDGSAKRMAIKRDPLAPPTAKFRLFSNTADTMLTLKDLQLFNGSVDGAGGAVLSAGDLTIDHCSLGDNKASAAGGAIYFDGGTLIVVDSDLGLNSAQTGGAIHIGPDAKFVSIVDTDIEENTADYGGGIYVYGSTNTTAPTYVSLYTVPVRGNTAATAGGGIYVGRNSTGLGTDLTLDGKTRISKNSSINLDSQGGGIYFGMGVLRANSVTISGNFAYEGDGMYRVRTTTTLVGEPVYVAPNREQLGD